MPKNKKAKVLLWKDVLSGMGVYIGEAGMIGNVHVFTVAKDSNLPKTFKEKIQLYCDLPGIEQNLGRFKTEDEAKEFSESVFETWLNTAVPDLIASIQLTH